MWSPPSQLSSPYWQVTWHQNTFTDFYWINFRGVSFCENIEYKNTFKVKRNDCTRLFRPKPRLSLWPITKETDNTVNESKLEALNTCCRQKERENCASASRLVLVLLLFGWQSGASFLSQSLSIANPKKILFTCDTRVEIALSSTVKIGAVCF